MNKVADLMERLERVKLARAAEPEPDGLSVSLREFGAELAALDDDGIAAMAEDLGITPEGIREMARAYAR